MNAEKDIKKLLDEIAYKFNGGSSRSEWTKIIKMRLACLGKKNGVRTAASVANADYGEWLYDLTWWKYKGNYWNNMQSIELAMESEWSAYITDLENDFLKLVYAKARLKLFIFGAYSEKECRKKIRRLEKLAKLCEDKNNDKYLFSCAIIDKGEKFIHKSFTAKRRKVSV